MKLIKKLLSLALCLAMLASTAVVAIPSSAAAGTTPAQGAFIFSAEEARQYLVDPHSVEMEYDTEEESMRFMTNSSAAKTMTDPYVYLCTKDLGLKSADYPYVQITYRISTDVATANIITEVWGVVGDYVTPTSSAILDDTLMRDVLDPQIGVYNMRSEYSPVKSACYQTQTVNMGAAVKKWNNPNTPLLGIRLDTTRESDFGDLYYLDSIIFAKTEAEAVAAGQARLAVKKVAEEGGGSVDVTPHPEGKMLYYNSASSHDINKETKKPEFQWQPERPGEGTFKIEWDMAFVSNRVKLSLRNQTFAEPIEFDTDLGYFNVINRRYDYDWGATGADKWHHIEMSFDQGSIHNAGVSIFIDGKMICMNEYGAPTGIFAIEEKDPNEFIFGYHYPLTDAMVFDFEGIIYIDNVNFTFAEEMEVFEDFNSLTHYQAYFWHGTVGDVDPAWANPAGPITESRQKYCGWEMKDTVTSLDFAVGERPGSGSCELEFDLGFGDVDQDTVPYIELRSTDKPIRIAADGVTLNGQFTPYNWGKAVIATWHHIRIQFDKGGALGGAKLYIDGDLIAQCSTGFNSPSSSHYYFDKPDTCTAVIDNVYFNALASKGWAERYNFEELNYVGLFTGGEVAKLRLGLHTSSKAEPAGHGWYWDVDTAYGYLVDGSDNGQDLVLQFDLCLMPCAEPSICSLYTNHTDKAIAISQYEISIGAKRFPFYWGEISNSNWHRIKVVFDVNARATVYVDDVEFGTGLGMKANEGYQLLFSYRGEMSVDNFTLASTAGKKYFTGDFEDEESTKQLWGNGLGEWVDLKTSTVKYDLNGGTMEDGIPYGYKLVGEDLVITKLKPSKPGYTFLGWSESKSATAPTYRPKDLYKADVATTLFAIWIEDNHQHSYGEWFERVKPTCTEPGLKVRTCYCGAELTEEISALGHKISGNIQITEATCFLPSYRVVYCANCDGVYAKVALGSSLGHDYKITSNEATAITHGGDVYSCARCSYEFEVNTTAPTSAIAIHAKGTENEEKTVYTLEVLLDNNTGLNSLALSLGYNEEAIKLSSYTNGTVFSAANGAGLTMGRTAANPVKMFFDHNQVANITANGKLITFVFEILDINTPYGIELKVDDKNTFKANSSATGVVNVPVNEIYVDSLLTANTVLINCDHLRTELRNAVTAQCLTPGYTGDTVCLDCGTTIAKGTVIDAPGHDWNTVSIIKAATCAEEGSRSVKCKNCVATDVVAIEKLPHTPVVDKRVNPSCTTPGLTEGSHCSKCPAIIVPQITIPAKGHTEVIDPAVAVKCTEDGWTQGVHCSECGDILVEQQKIKATGHSYEDGICIYCHMPERGEHLAGDVDNDSDVDNNDLIRLMKYLAGEDVLVNNDALDITNDGKINAKDLTRLMKYLADNSVVIY